MAERALFCHLPHAPVARRADDLPSRLDKLPARPIPAAEVVLLDISAAGGTRFFVIRQQILLSCQDESLKIPEIVRLSWIKSIDKTADVSRIFFRYRQLFTNAINDEERRMIQTAKTRNAFAIRLEQLAQMYRDDQASEVMERTLIKLFQYEADVCRDQLAQLTKDLAEYEQQYGQSSQAFYAQFQQGRTDDRMDYVEWTSLFQMTQRLQHRLQLLNIGENA